MDALKWYGDHPWLGTFLLLILAELAFAIVRVLFEKRR